MYLPPIYRQKRFVVLLFSLVCKIRSGTTELSKPVNITVEVHEGRVEGRYSIDGKAEMPGFTFVVISAIIIYLQILYIPITTYWTYIFFIFFSFNVRNHFPDVCLPQFYKKLSLQIPNITEIQPNYGPRIGGTLITVTGPHLDAGKTRKVTLNDVPCPIKRSGNTSLLLNF